MIKKIKLFIYSYLFLFVFFNSVAYSEIIKKIVIEGNQRISNQTILMFSNLSKEQNLENDDINEVVKTLYDTNFFKKDLKLQAFQPSRRTNFVPKYVRTIHVYQKVWSTLVYYCSLLYSIVFLTKRLAEKLAVLVR